MDLAPDLPGAGSSVSNLLGLGVALAAGLVMAVVWFLRRRSARPSMAPNAEKAAEEALLEIAERIPGEDRDSLLTLAEEEGLTPEAARAAFQRLVERKVLKSEKDSEGIERWVRSLDPVPEPDPASPAAPAGTTATEDA